MQIALLSEFGEAEAWSNYYLCAPPEFAQHYRVEAKKIGSVWVTMIPEVDWAFLNRIVVLGVVATATESELDEAISLLHDAGCQNYTVQLCPLAQPAQVTEWLEVRGFTKSRNWAKMYRGNEPALEFSTDLRIELICPELADSFSDVALAAFEIPSEFRPLFNGIIGKPGWRHYVAFDEEQPVATGALFVRENIGWLGFGSTLASHRKRSGQSAMFARRIQNGLDLGCKWFVTETGEDTPENPNPSYRNMLRSGFKLAYLRPNYVHQHESG
jgi:hypothetical protein